MCKAKMDMTKEIGWVIGALSTRDRKVNSATISPDDKWAAPTTAEPAVGFDDGTRLFHYHLASPDSSGISGAPMCSDDGSIVDPSSLSVRHIFNGNRAPLQAGASVLFETLQRDVRIERSIGSTGFSTPPFESGDDPVLRLNGRSLWDQQTGIIENTLSKYCGDLGTLRVCSLRIHAWISDGKVRLSRWAAALAWVDAEDFPHMQSLQHRQTFSSRFKHLILLCLGADISLLLILSDPSNSTSHTKSNSKAKKETLRVTMVHGDIVVLSGSRFEARETPALYLTC